MPLPTHWSSAGGYLLTIKDIPGGRIIIGDEIECGQDDAVVTGRITDFNIPKTRLDSPIKSPNSFQTNLENLAACSDSWSSASAPEPVTHPKFGWKWYT